MCTDNAANCKNAGALIEEAYPHITWSPCAAHVCDLALEDIFKLDYFQEVHNDTKAFVTFINNHHATLAAWRSLVGPDQAIDLSSSQAPATSSNLALLKPGDTRFASAFLMLERTLMVKAKLQQFVVSDGWNAAIGAMKRADQVRHKGYSSMSWEGVVFLNIPELVMSTGQQFNPTIIGQLTECNTKHTCAAWWPTVNSGQHQPHACWVPIVGVLDTFMAATAALVPAGQGRGIQGHYPGHSALECGATGSAAV